MFGIWKKCWANGVHLIPVRQPFASQGKAQMQSTNYSLSFTSVWQHWSLWGWGTLIPLQCQSWALRHLGTLTLAETLAEVSRIAKMQKRSYCFNAGRTKGHEGFSFAVLWMSEHFCVAVFPYNMTGQCAVCLGSNGALLYTVNDSRGGQGTLWMVLNRLRRCMYNSCSVDHLLRYCAISLFFQSLASHLY